ncbi:MAG: glycosyltransferase [Synechococcales cyanobacterium M58_A2018_015]|nr:glycosyltransferase [Synechococcales cyanobacterium M58_A2018_015]
MNVLFINDVGFQYGAGIAMLRQIQSFLVMGHTVSGLCWRQGQIEASIPLPVATASGQWLGMTELLHLHRDYGVSNATIIENLVCEAQLRSPDVIIIGNLHGANWPLDLLPALHSTIGCPVVAYMHDCYLITGRCAYTGDCLLYRVGCNETCPTWQQYPSLPPEQIFEAWTLRRQIFCGANGIPMAANSQWTLKMACSALQGITHAECIYYGLDETLFQPIDKALARRLLGIPEDYFVVLGGCVDIHDRRKGGHIFNQIVPKLRDRVHFLVFGANSQQLPGVQGTGLVRDYRRMPLIFNAADVFVGTSLEEAFGQTFCEAAACGVPIVAFNRDGIPEVARHDNNARLVQEVSADAMIAEIEFFRKHPEARKTFGANGRAMVEAEFTLVQQGKRWMNYLQHLPANATVLHSK